MSDKGGRPRYPWNIPRTLDVLSALLGVPSDHIGPVPHEGDEKIDSAVRVLMIFRAMAKLLLLGRPYVQAVENLERVTRAMHPQIQQCYEEYRNALTAYEPVGQLFGDGMRGDFLLRERPDLVDLVGGQAGVDQIVDFMADKPVRICELLRDLALELQPYDERGEPRSMSVRVEELERMVRDLHLVWLETERIYQAEITEIFDPDGFKEDKAAAMMRIRKDISRLRGRFPKLFDRSMSDLLAEEAKHDDGRSIRYVYEAARDRGTAVRSRKNQTDGGEAEVGLLGAKITRVQAFEARRSLRDALASIRDARPSNTNAKRPPSGESIGSRSDSSRGRNADSTTSTSPRSAEGRAAAVRPRSPRLPIGKRTTARRQP